MMLPLFVYGTLLEPGRRATLLGPHRDLGEARAPGRLYDVGPYPALVEDRRSTVPGRLLELRDAGALQRADDYEGVPEGLYERRRRRVRLADGTPHDAWIYVYRRSVDGLSRIEAWPPR